MIITLDRKTLKPIKVEGREEVDLDFMASILGPVFLREIENEGRLTATSKARGGSDD